MTMGALQMIGMRLGVYEVQSLLGSGGMASVYRGFDHNLQRPVAIKILSADVAAQPGFAERFRQEARLIARLRHPNIVHVYDFGEQGGQTYMVQELLPGPTLEQRLLEHAQQGTHLRRYDVLSITAQLAGALDAAHAAGVIHRDVKPANALWNAHGELVLTDFGIAKNTMGGTNQTQVGVVLGTPDYLSPEQAQGLPLTPASDIYSLGVLLYELLSGKPPFQSPTPLGVVLQHIQAPPPSLQSLRSDLPPAVETIVQRALAKDPAGRYGSAADLARALEQAWSAPPQYAGVLPPSLHNQATTVWQSPAGAPPVKARPAAAPASPQPIVASRSPSMTPAPSSPLRLLVLGGLLLALLGSGMWLALQNERAPATASAPTTVAATTEAAGIASADDPTAAPATAAPAATATALPTSELTVAPAGPLSALRALLVEATNDGRIKGDSAPLVQAVDEAQRALDAGDTTTATTKLTDIQRQLLAGPGQQTIDPVFMQEALLAVDAVARAYNLTLPFSVSAD